MQYIYAYYFKDGSAYVGRTECPELRHKQHVWLTGDNDYFRQKVKENGNKVPEMKILVKTDNESINMGIEELFIKVHERLGYTVLNKATGTFATRLRQLSEDVINTMFNRANLYINKNYRTFFDEVQFFSLAGLLAPVQQTEGVQKQAAPAETLIDNGEVKVTSIQMSDSEYKEVKHAAFEREIKITKLATAAINSFMSKHPDGLDYKIQPSKRGNGAKIRSFWIPQNIIKNAKLYAHKHDMTLTELLRMAFKEYIN